MLTPDEAAREITGAIEPLPGIEVALTAADGLVLEQPVTSPIALPLWANSAMDGYACRSSDVSGASESAPVLLHVIEDIRAGAFPTKPVGRGEATRIATGAPVPDGADTVIRVEDTDAGVAAVSIRLSRDAGRNVRPAGEDVRANEIALEAGTPLGPAQIALLASVGAANVRVHRRPRVAIITTGDELVTLDRFDEVIARKRIVSSNSYGLAAGIRSAGGEPVDFGIARDIAGEVSDVLSRATDCDLIITSAGVSVGEGDYVKGAITGLGGSVEFWRVQMRPGSPLAFGMVRGVPWIGLPGNPVSSLVTFELFARPAIRRLMGHRNIFARRVTVIVDEPIALAGTLTHFLRVRLSPSESGPARARLAGPQPSNILSSLARADALLIVPGDRREIRAGDALEAIPLGGTAL
jgi:molybdopterin molybdotransferase